MWTRRRSNTPHGPIVTTRGSALNELARIVRQDGRYSSVQVGVGPVVVVDVDRAGESTEVDEPPNYRGRVVHDEASTVAEQLNSVQDHVNAGRVHVREVGKIKPDGSAAAGRAFDRDVQCGCAAQVEFACEMEEPRRFGMHGERGVCPPPSSARFSVIVSPHPQPGGGRATCS